MKKGNFKSLLFAVFCGFYAFCATAATSLFSDYGQIQNVQNYSTNPFWTPGSPYNQRLPQPVYVQGADLTAEDCFNVVQPLVAVQCSVRDNCKNTTLSDIRPTIMIQLSNLPNNNYVSACSGYIDYVFETYVAQYGNNLPNRAVAFPTGTVPNQNLNNENNRIEIKNPYKIETPKWKQEINERSNELQSLQQQNGAGSEHLSANAFPMTFNDLSLSERITVKAEGYAPYKDKSAYVVPDFKSASEWCSSGDHASSPECVAFRDCTDTLKGKVDHMVHAEYNADHSVCQVKQCDAGWRPNKTANGCIENKDTPCKLNVPYEERSAIDDDGICKIQKCEKGWRPDADKTACERAPSSDCTDDMQNVVPHVVIAEVDANGECRIKECEPGWKPKDPDHQECIADTGNECDDVAKQMDPHALKGEYNANGICTITECDGGWQPSFDGVICEDADLYYTLALCFTSSEDKNDIDKHYCLTTLNYKPNYLGGAINMLEVGDNGCFPVCGQGNTLNTPIAQSINTLFNTGSKTYCVPNIDFHIGKHYYKLETNNFSVIDQDTGDSIKFNKDKLKEVRDAMYRHSDDVGSTKACDNYHLNIDALIIEHKKGQQPVTHTIIRIDD